MLPSTTLLLKGHIDYACWTTEVQRMHTCNDEKPTMILTWPKKRKGNRKVNPLHIQDWNPSEDRTCTYSMIKNKIKLCCFFFFINNYTIQECLSRTHTGLVHYIVVQSDLIMWYNTLNFEKGKASFLNDSIFLLSVLLLMIVFRSMCMVYWTVL